MTGATLKVKFQDREIVAAMEKLERLGRDMSPAMKEIGEYLLESHDQRFSDQVDPEGNAWAPLSQVIRSGKNGTPILSWYWTDFSEAACAIRQAINLWNLALTTSRLPRISLVMMTETYPSDPSWGSQKPTNWKFWPSSAIT
ncbi:MAG: hypothetical protein GKR93_11995 [Gammaproteobacteria bacterium]|nr:hypothetical protein [Gammaproteobacteria bacterium]